VEAIAIFINGKILNVGVLIPGDVKLVQEEVITHSRFGNQVP